MMNSGPAQVNPFQSLPLSFSFYPKESNKLHVNTSWGIMVPRCRRGQSQCLHHTRFRGKVVDLAKIAMEGGCFISPFPSTLSRNLLCKGILNPPKKTRVTQKRLVNHNDTFSPDTHGYQLSRNSRVGVVLKTP